MVGLANYEGSPQLLLWTHERLGVNSRPGVYFCYNAVSPATKRDQVFNSGSRPVLAAKIGPVGLLLSAKWSGGAVLANFSVKIGAAGPILV